MWLVALEKPMPDYLSTSLVVALGASGVLLAAVWLALGIWAYRDMRSRSRAVSSALLVLVLVLLLPLAGLLVYLLLRPRETLVEAYDRALEQEALLQQIEEPLSCPGCARRVIESWIVCPDCRTQLRQPCPNCGRPLDLRWTICPYCTYELVAADPAALELTPLRQPGDDRHISVADAKLSPETTD